MRFVTALAAVAALLLASAPAHAGPVGEAHATAPDPSAALRFPEGDGRVRLTVWYPAADGAAMHPVRIGPPDAPFFEEGEAAPDAPWAQGPRRPLLIVSHGFGGAAAQMAWFGTAMAARGYVVVAIDHPGQNGRDGITLPAVVMPWLRTDDVRAAIDWALSDPSVSSRVDPRRIGFAGFSQGGYTGLSMVGARSSTAHFLAFCAKTPSDPICQPPNEDPKATPALMVAQAKARPDIVAAVAHDHDDHSDPRVRAVFAMAPAPIQLLDPASLKDIRRPVMIVVGSRDPVALPATNGLAAAPLIPGAALRVAPGVGHYDFLDACTDAGRRALPEFCGGLQAPQAKTHARAIAQATAFFEKTLTAAP